MSSGHRNWLLCGGIGSGKSTVRAMLADRGFFTIDADSVGHEVLAPGGSRVDAVAETWPSVFDNGIIDRKKLGNIVFSDSEQLKKLESITHPAIFEEIQRRVDATDKPVIVELPLLRQPFDPPAPRIVVDAPESVQIRRAVARGQSEADVVARRTNQPSREEWLGAADLVLPNVGSLVDLENSVDELVSILLA